MERPGMRKFVQSNCRLQLLTGRTVFTRFIKGLICRGPDLLSVGISPCGQPPAVPALRHPERPEAAAATAAGHIKRGSVPPDCRRSAL